MRYHCIFCKLDFQPLHTGIVRFERDQVVEEIVCPHCVQVLIFQTHVIKVIKLDKPKVVGFKR